MGEVTPETLFEIYLKDLEEDLASDQTPSDVSRARSAMRDELEEFIRSQEDRRMAVSIGQACTTDEPEIDRLESEERRDQEDRTFAFRLSGQNEPAHSPPSHLRSNPPRLSLNLSRYSDLAAFNTNRELTLEDVAPAVQEFADSRDNDNDAAQQDESQVECNTCYDSVPRSESLKADCGHIYCSECLNALVRRATKDESLYPPRCCRLPISVESAMTLIPWSLWNELKERSIEYSTPHRTHCANIECGKFIKPKDIENDKASCKSCDTITCNRCKEKWHEGQCKDDEAMRLLLKTAEQEDWKRCVRCNRMIQISHGCNHMRCVCKAEFCYECGAEWRTCLCAIFNEQRLIAQAAEEAVPEHEGEEVDEAAIERARQRIIANYDCPHRRWEWHSGRQDCHFCDTDLDSFYYQCQRCEITACTHCRFNRL